MADLSATGFAINSMRTANKTAKVHVHPYLCGDHCMYTCAGDQSIDLCEDHWIDLYGNNSIDLCDDHCIYTCVVITACIPV